MSFWLYNIALDEIFLRLVCIFYVCNFLIKVNAKICLNFLDDCSFILASLISSDEEQVLRGRTLMWTKPNIYDDHYGLDD